MLLIAHIPVVFPNKFSLRVPAKQGAIEPHASCSEDNLSNHEEECDQAERLWSGL